jgi:hypothetical protein
MTQYAPGSVNCHVCYSLPRAPRVKLSRSEGSMPRTSHWIPSPGPKARVLDPSLPTTARDTRPAQGRSDWCRWKRVEVPRVATLRTCKLMNRMPRVTRARPRSAPWSRHPCRNEPLARDCGVQERSSLDGSLSGSPAAPRQKASARQEPPTRHLIPQPRLLVEPWPIGGALAPRSRSATCRRAPCWSAGLSPRDLAAQKGDKTQRSDCSPLGPVHASRGSRSAGLTPPRQPRSDDARDQARASGGASALARSSRAAA